MKMIGGIILKMKIKMAIVITAVFMTFIGVFAGNAAAEDADISIAFMYGDTYYENVLIPGSTLIMPISITNAGDDERDLVLYIAEYDLSGQLKGITAGRSVVVPGKQTVTVSLSSTFASDMDSTAKVFVWEKNSMTPISDSVIIKTENQDFYADTFSEAREIDLDMKICGVINSEEDIDVVKFTSDTEGVYIIRLSAVESVVCELCDAAQKGLDSVAAEANGTFLFYRLNAEENYYIRLSGNSDSSYTIKITNPDEIKAVEKNSGFDDSVDNSQDYNVYVFQSEKTGEYVITAIGEAEVKSELYDSNYKKIDSSSVGDDDVSFRITSEMTAESNYYIVAMPKAGAHMDSYKLYVEEPLRLISIE